ncbi:MAG: molecular chaperone DnaK (HSP70), partial [Paraglaciecola sp.]
MQTIPEYFIGVDLGTTNIVVCYAHNKTASPLKQLSIPQLVAAGQVSSLPMLPACRYHYLQEIDDKQVVLPWPIDAINSSLPPAIIGKWAAELGASVPSRFISSAKSWLSHEQASEGQIRLPIESDSQISTCTPLEVTAGYLAYIQAAWDFQFPETIFSQQDIVVTVPASFDDVARSLTIEAIKQIGVTRFKLLEEPQAAFYCWLSGNNLVALINKQNLFVCDVGGGTCDFTLISLKDSANRNTNTSSEPDVPNLKRVGVGEHLMLGGDNMDLALAVKVQQKLGSAGAGIKALLQLLPQCQRAKEILLAGDAPDEVKIQVSGAGSNLLGSTKETRLTRNEVENMLVDGFFPFVSLKVKPRNRKTALTKIGLPYPADPSITAHISAFFQMHQRLLENRHQPESVATTSIADVWLLNGGVFLSEKLKQRLVEQIGQWRDEPVVWLENVDHQSAVAYGATYYARSLYMQKMPAQAKAQNGKKDTPTLIQSAASRHYFVKVSSSEGNKAVNILPKNTPLHQRLSIPGQTFHLHRGKAVQFTVGSSLDDKGYVLGEKIDWHEKLHVLPPLTTKIEGEGQLPVNLITELDELGVLKLELVHQQEKQSWQLDFNLRKSDQSHALTITPEIKRAVDAIIHWFGDASRDLPKEPLRKTLERSLGKRDTWSGAVARHLFDQLMSLAKKRRRSMQHERAWLNIAGFCLRPGMGFAGDPMRIANVWPLFEQGVQFVQNVEVWVQWWAFWRRAAPGLTTEQQKQIFIQAEHVLRQKPQSQSSKVKLRAAKEEKLRLIGALEKLPVEDKRDILDHIA